MKKFSNLTIIITVLICAGIIVFGGLFIAARPCTSNPEKNVQRVEVPSGVSVKTVGKLLKSKNLIRSDFVFYLCARSPAAGKILTGRGDRLALKSGVYSINSSMSIPDIFAQLSSGQQEYIRVSIPEGLTVSKIAAKLEQAGVCSAFDFIQASRDSALLREFNIPGESFEGFLFPDTYFFNPQMSGESCIRQMVGNFSEKIKTVKGASELSAKDLYYYVSLASIVEREYRIDSEAPLIASVFKNRLKHNIGLYSCATVEYVITEILGRPHPDVITYADLAIDSPYNTYKWAGLPPGPISNPGLVALDAAINAPKTDYYFFRLIDANAGRHIFSKDFNTHVSEGYIYNTKKTGTK